MDKPKEAMLTTIDNPFDPFDDFERWNLEDVERGYNTCCFLARVARTSDEFTEEENLKAIDEAMNEIIANDFLGVYIKVYKDSKTS